VVKEISVLELLASILDVPEFHGRTYYLIVLMEAIKNKELIVKG